MLFRSKSTTESLPSLSDAITTIVKENEINVTEHYHHHEEGDDGEKDLGKSGGGGNIDSGGSGGSKMSTNHNGDDSNYHLHLCWLLSNDKKELTLKWTVKFNETSSGREPIESIQIYKRVE